MLRKLTYLILCVIFLTILTSSNAWSQSGNQVYDPPPGEPCNPLPGGYDPVSGWNNTQTAEEQQKIWNSVCAQEDQAFPEAQACVCTFGNRCAASCCGEEADSPFCEGIPLEACDACPEELWEPMWNTLLTCLDQACNSCCTRNGFKDGKMVTIDQGQTTASLCDCGPGTFNVPAQPLQASIQVQPEEGAPLSTAEVTGEDFPGSVDVEIRWEDENGTLVGEGAADATGRIKIPIVIPEVEEGEYPVVAVYNDNGRQIASTKFNVRLLCIEGQVRVNMRDGWPLAGVEVSLWWQDPNLPANRWPVTDVVTSANWVAANDQGRYRICSPLIGLPSRFWLLQVRLGEVQTNAYALFDVPAGDLAQGYFGVNNAIGADFNDVKTWFTLETAADLRRDLVFEDIEDKVQTTNVREDHGLDAAIIYYHLHQALEVYQALNVSISRPIQVDIYAPENTSANGTTIYINEYGSDWNDANAPKNREWHEYSHCVMWHTYGGAFPPQHRERRGIGLAGDINGNHIIDQDRNHAPYLFNALSSSDALVEGFAEGMAMIIADQMNQAGQPYLQDPLAPFIYTIADRTSFPEMFNFEINYHQNVVPSLPQEKRKIIYDVYRDFQNRSLYDDFVPETRELPIEFTRGDEENSVASLLWDLYDETNPADGDQIQLPLDRLWAILSGVYTFPQYYPGEIITSFLGDPVTFAGKFTYYNLAARLGAYEGVRDLATPYPTEARHIGYIKDLYDALVGALPGQKAQINQVFTSHAISVDTYRVLEDYQARQAADIITFGDQGTQVKIKLGPQAQYSFWGQGIIADLKVTGWGAGFTIPKQYDARGYLYLWNWLNVPQGINFDIVVEDYNGQWLSPGTSEALYELASAPADWSKFQRGTGSWSAWSPAGMAGGPFPFVAGLGPSSAAETWKHVYAWKPNSNYKTPPSGISGPDIRDIQAIGVLFTTPGSYQALVGGSVLVADYPWKAGVKSVYGLGDNALGVYLPYRRDHPVVAGSRALIEVDQAPAVVQVTLQYGSPYENLSFTYPLTVTQKTQAVWLYIEPAFDGLEAKIQLAAGKPGKTPGKALMITNAAYWEQLGNQEYVLTSRLSTRPALGAWLWAFSGGVGAVLVGGIIFLVIQRCKRKTQSQPLSDDWLDDFKM